MDMIEKLSAREEIRDLLHRYCKGIDRKDWKQVQDCFADDHVHKHGEFIGPPEEFIGFASAVLENVPAAHHSISNLHIELNVNCTKASTESKFVAYHYIVEGNPDFAAVPTGGKANDWIVAGRYCDTFEKRNRKWIIVRREAFHDWERYDEAIAKPDESYSQ